MMPHARRASLLVALSLLTLGCDGLRRGHMGLVGLQYFNCSR